MNADEIQTRLLKAAQALPPSDAAPYLFEKRVMAAVRSAPAKDPWVLWTRVLWRAAAPCVGIMLVVSAWTALASWTAHPTASLAADFERTLWGPLTSINYSW